MFKKIQQQLFALAICLLLSIASLAQTNDEFFDFEKLDKDIEVDTVYLTVSDLLNLSSMTEIYPHSVDVLDNYYEFYKFEASFKGTKRGGFWEEFSGPMPVSLKNIFTEFVDIGSKITFQNIRVKNEDNKVTQVKGFVVAVVHADDKPQQDSYDDYWDEYADDPYTDDDEEDDNNSSGSDGGIDWSLYAPEK